MPDLCNLYMNSLNKPSFFPDFIAKDDSSNKYDAFSVKLKDLSITILQSLEIKKLRKRHEVNIIII